MQKEAKNEKEISLTIWESKPFPKSANIYFFFQFYEGDQNFEKISCAFSYKGGSSAL